jgi:hypothetical protein
VRLRAAFESDDEAHVVMELCNGGDVQQLSEVLAVGGGDGSVCVCGGGVFFRSFLSFAAVFVSSRCCRFAFAAFVM